MSRLISTLWECDSGRIYINKDITTGEYFAADNTGKSIGLGQPENTISNIQIMFQQLWEQEMIESILDKDDEYIKAVLTNEPRFSDAEGQKWLFDAKHQEIKYLPLNHTTGWKISKKYKDIKKMAGDWNRLKFRLESEAPAEVEVLPPESLPATVAGYTPEQLTGQYRRAISGTLEIIRFGAMLVDIDSCLQRETAKQRNQHSGETVKGWLEQHCPDINYKCAMKYKGLAGGLQEYFRIPAKLPLSAALPEPDGSVNVHKIPLNCRVSPDKVEKIQVQVWEMVNGKSMRQLTFDFMTESKQRGGDRKSHLEKKKLTKEQELELQIKAAGDYWNDTLNDLCFQVKSTRSHRLLNEDQLTQALTRLRVVSDAIRKALDNNNKES